MAGESLPPTPTVRLRRLGATLRRLREAANLTLEEAGAQLERSLSSLSKIENGRVRIPPRDLRVILDFYGVNEEPAREALLLLSRDARKRGWWQRYGDVLSPSYLDFISLEADAAEICTFETGLVPGLLQTQDYARAVIAAVPDTDGAARDVDQLLAVRMARQEVLSRDHPLTLWAIVDEALLHRHIGGREVMRSQLQHLVQVGGSSHVTLQVLPYAVGAHAGINGPFTILEFPEIADLDVVLLESQTSGLYLEQAEEVRRYRTIFNHLRASAKSAAASRVMIEDIAKQL
ncbi:helix-turn-helix domain-containing protein [Streptosporangium sp. NBC_01810]|uniref:helix-turn-helix domain-containing protein n=1 Tax=Streptosporangium sp. NBC_01810 TaxID=2975951 RepID=UPI002DD91170|nr:helix-turn-helix transcriptional regulator [Streptosporangium sp. NBC_01810]